LLFLETSTRKFSVYDGTTQCNFSAAQTLPITSPVKVVSAWGGTRQRGSAAGSVAVSGAYNGTMLGSNLRIGSVGNPWYGTIRRVKIYGQAANDPGVQRMAA
jgi:hypothetical protein